MTVVSKEVESLSTFTEGRSSSSLIGDEGVARQHKLNCSICRRAPTDPVLAASGQDFCLPCIYRWVLNYPPNSCPVCRHVYEAGACNATTMACARSQGIAGVPAGPNNSSLGVSNARVWADEKLMQRTMRAEIQSLERRNSVWEQVVDKYEARARIVDLKMANMAYELSRLLEKANELSRCNAKLQEQLERANELLPKSRRVLGSTELCEIAKLL